MAIGLWALRVTKSNVKKNLSLDSLDYIFLACFITFKYYMTTNLRSNINYEEYSFPFAIQFLAM